MFWNFCNIFLPKWSKLIWNGQFWQFWNFCNIFLPKWSKLILNGQFWPFCNFFNILLLKCSELIWIGQFWLFCNFSSIFLPKWSKLIQNGQFGLLASFLINSHQSALKLFAIVTKVFRTYNFHFKCLFPGNITPYGPWGTVLAHLQKYIGGWLRFHYNSSGFNLAGCLPC